LSHFGGLEHTIPTGSEPGGTRTEVNRTDSFASAVGARLGLEKVVHLLDHSEPVGLATEGLSTLISQFGASAASLFYASRPPLSVRRGEMTPAMVEFADRWESGVERRIGAGAWNVGSGDELRAAWQPVPGTDSVAVQSLIVRGGKVGGTLLVAFAAAQVPAGGQRNTFLQYVQALGRTVSLVSELSLTRERLTQLNLFYQVAQSMASTFDLGKVLDDTMQLATAVLDASASALMLIEKETGDLVFEYTHGEMGALLRKQRTRQNEGIAGWVATHGEPVVVNDVHQDPRFSPQVDARTGFLTQSVLCVPIQIRGTIIGVLEALNKRSDAGFDAEDMSLMITTANQAAVAIENAQLYQSLRDERDRIIRAQEDVRRQVARNLHDGTVQFLSAITMGIDHLERLIELKPEAAPAELGALRDLAREATRQARLAIFELRPLILETQGLSAALESYVQQLQGSRDFRVHFQASPALPGMNGAVAATVFAIVQEAVTNAKKHACARDVWLRLQPEESWLQVTVEDNGAGFDSLAVQQNYDRKGSIGLLSMQERAELIEAEFRIESSNTPPKTGTRIILRVPVTGPAQPETGE
jgi:signal transduction histidine kinase